MGWRCVWKSFKAVEQALELVSCTCWIAEDSASSGVFCSLCLYFSKCKYPWASIWNMRADKVCHILLYQLTAIWFPLHSYFPLFSGPLRVVALHMTVNRMKKLCLRWVFSLSQQITQCNLSLHHILASKGTTFVAAVMLEALSKRNVLRRGSIHYSQYDFNFLCLYELL